MSKYNDLYGEEMRSLHTAAFLIKLVAGLTLALIVFLLGFSIWTTAKVSKWSALLLPGLFHAGRKDW